MSTLKKEDEEIARLVCLALVASGLEIKHGNTDKEANLHIMISQK